MAASLLTPADILSRPRHVPVIARDYIPTAQGLRHLQASGAEIIEKGIDQKSMSFAAVVSTPEIDRVGDSLNPLGCDVTDYADNPLVLLNHNSDGIPIGVAVDSTGKLYVAIEKDRVLSRCFLVQGGRFGQDAEDIFHLVVQRAFNSTSVGFNPDPDPRYTKRLETGGNRYERWFMLEWSLTAIPCNPEAQIIRKYLTDGRITGKSISPRLVKCLTPLAEPKVEQVVGGFAAPAGFNGLIEGRCAKCGAYSCPHISAFAAPAVTAAQSSPTKQGSRRVSKKWGKPGRAKKREIMSQKHIRHEGGKWVLYSHDGSKVLGRHDSEEEAKKQEAAIMASKEDEEKDMPMEGGDEPEMEEKALSESSGTEGGYSVAEGDDDAGPNTPEADEQDEDDSPLEEEEEAEEGEDEDDTGRESDVLEKQLRKEYMRKAQLAFHVGRGKAYQMMAKRLPAQQKSELEDCVHHKIPKIAEDHPEMETDQREAVAYSMCGEKSFTKEFEDKPSAEGDVVAEQPGQDQPIAPDTTAQMQPPSLQLAQQAIENIEAALPGLEPECRHFWEHIIAQVRQHGSERYPEEDFGGEESGEQMSDQEAAQGADQITESYSHVPKRITITFTKAMDMMKKGDLVKALAEGLDASAQHHHYYAGRAGRMVKKEDAEASHDHARMMDHLSGAVKHALHSGEDTKPEDEPIEPHEDGHDETEAAHVVEKLFNPNIEKEVEGAVNKYLESLSDRLTGLYGTKSV